MLRAYLILLFTDNTLLFFEAKNEPEFQVKDILKKYVAAMGQLLNSSKCSILFGSACPLVLQIAICDVLGVETALFEER